jgi:serine/threonine-protein kinase
MPQDLDSLRDALKDRYTVERELGRGGMATVYLAHDRKLGRAVALKVLRPELAAALGGGRFVREIEIAARLTHPHILGVHDSGDADGILYYTMPYVEGESLRERLTRERQLPLEDTLQITREVADALGYAHALGIVHRDIKPENILFTGGHAVVADFGIAKAITSAGGDRLTETGLSIGTPAYMSPEQASGHDQVDGRSDLYSLGCVLYEMLAGHPPFQGTTAHELLARHATDPVPPLRTGRATIPEPIEAAVERVLAKVPADRFPTAEQFSAALQIDATAYRKRQRTLKALRRIAVVPAAALVLVAGAYGAMRYRAATNWKRQPMDQNTVAVVPFRVTATDEAVRTLDRGLPDMLYSVLTGGAVPRAVDIGRMLRKRDEMEGRRSATFADADLRLAADLGAGLLLTGAVVQAGTVLMVNALLQRVPSGDEVARHSFRVPVDSMNLLPGGVVLGLLGEQLGEDRERLEMFARQDPRAVQVYLAGVRAEREGSPDAALQRYEEAERIDSTFALPVLRIAHMAWKRGGLGGRWAPSLRRARDLRDRLGPRDQALLWFGLVNRGDAVDSTENAVAILEATRRWASLAPDDAEAQVLLALALRLAGAIAGIPDWQAQYRLARERAWRLDSVTPQQILDHAYYFSVETGDREWAGRVLPSFLAHVDSTAERWAGTRWALAYLLGDSASVRQFRARLAAGDPSLSGEGLWPVYELGARGYIRGDAVVIGSAAVNEAFVLLLPVGRVKDAAALMEPWALVQFAYAYVGLDEAAAEAADTLQARYAKDPRRFGDGCRSALHRSVGGDTVGARQLARALLPQYRKEGYLGICPAMVEALVESWDTTRRDTPALDSLEASMRLGPGTEWPAVIGMVMVARLARQRGQWERALKAAGDGCCWGMAFSRHARAPLLREEGELATVVGDTARAIEAFTKYLNIRVAPDPGVVQAEVDSVRAALDALLRAKG